MFLDACFRVHGDSLPVDHGYKLFGAITTLIPDWHGNRDIAIFNVNGELIGGRQQRLTKKSRLSIRLPLEQLPSALVLAGKSLRVDTDMITVGVPYIHDLLPSPSLYSRLVTIRNFFETGESFLEGVAWQLDQLGVDGKPSLIESARYANGENEEFGYEPWLKRTVEIQGKRIVGFALRIDNLSDEDSIIIQGQGIGGRRRFGCGIFIPTKN